MLKFLKRAILGRPGFLWFADRPETPALVLPGQRTLRNGIGSPIPSAVRSIARFD